MPAVDTRILSGIGVLLAVVEAGSFVRAADALGITQSGVSRAVARLEARVGVRLFDRTSHSVTLTDEGRRLHDDVAPLLAAMEEATLRAGGAAAEARGRLRVSADAAAGHYLVAPRLHEFLARHPRVEVDLVVRDRMGDFVAEGYDVAVRFGEPEDSALTCRRLLTTRVLTCASPAYVARHGQPRHPLDLLEHECILVRDPSGQGTFGWELVRGRERVNVPVRGRLTVNDAGAMIAACLSGQGVGQPLAHHVGPMLRDGSLVQLLPDWADEEFGLYLYHRSRRLPSAKVRAFIDFALTLGSPRDG